MKNNLYVDVHIIQTVPPSCVNRDDTNSPKTAVYGGVTRARISSQSWKKAVRDMFHNDRVISSEKLGARTKKIVSMIAAEIVKIDSSIDLGKAEKSAVKILERADLKVKQNDATTEMLFFISFAQVEALAKLATENPEIDKINKDIAKKAFNDSPGIEIALFGRMVADSPNLKTDACAQVAHAISTHMVSNEFDYFTAVDDCSPGDNAGAAHIGTVEFNSSTLYRYATVAVHELGKHLGNDTSDAVCEFVRAFACSMPTGKQNTFANRTMPDAMLVTMRTDQPVNLVGAFERPVETQGGYVDGSVQAFITHTEKTYSAWLKKPEISFSVGEAFSKLGAPYSLSELLVELKKQTATMLSVNEDAG